MTFSIHSRHARMSNTIIDIRHRPRSMDAVECELSDGGIHGPFSAVLEVVSYGFEFRNNAQCIRMRVI